MKNAFLVCVPFTGLGLYGGFRGNRWLRNRVAVFKKFVIPSLLSQTDRDFIVWVAWREEEKNNPIVKELLRYMQAIPNFRVIFTYSGVPFWDDKYDDETARMRLFRTLKDAFPALMEVTSDCDEIYWLLQPSDDLYDRNTVDSVRKAFRETDAQAVSFTCGYICNYSTMEVLEYNPNTNPPFFAIKFDRKTFFDPGKHMNYTGPYKSHEYIGDKLKLAKFEGRGFLVGTHGENISTHFNHPFGGAKVEGVLDNFGISGLSPIRLPISYRKWVMRRLPYRWQRKLRYIFGELLYSRFYNWIRN
jgi:Putative rhamnosyl transferase